MLFLELRYNSQTMYFTLLKCIQFSVFFSIFTKLCNHQHHLVLEYFHYSKPISDRSPLPSVHRPWQPVTYFLFLWICLFYINEVLKYMAFCVWLLSLNAFSLIHVVAYISIYSVLYLSILQGILSSVS